MQEERCVTSDQLLLALVEKGRTRASKVLLAECTHVPVATVCAKLEFFALAICVLVCFTKAHLLFNRAAK